MRFLKLGAQKLGDKSGDFGPKSGHLLVKSCHTETSPVDLDHQTAQVVVKKNKKINTKNSTKNKNKDQDLPRMSTNMVFGSQLSNPTQRSMLKSSPIEACYRCPDVQAGLPSLKFSAAVTFY